MLAKLSPSEISGGRCLRASERPDGMRFEVRVRGDWTPAVAEQFGDFRVVRTSDGTVLSGDLDQAALHGLLERIRASGLELVDVRRPRGRREPRPS
jgi:hypothetical protein